MRQIRFKDDCVRWIRDGRKTTTFRKNRHGGLRKVVKGSWYKPRSLGLQIRLTPISKLTLKEVICNHFRTEGDFDSPDEFTTWLNSVGLGEKLPFVGWLHRIEVVEGVRG